MSFVCDESMIQRFIKNIELDANVCCKIHSHAIIFACYGFEDFITKGVSSRHIPVKDLFREFTFCYS